MSASGSPRVPDWDANEILEYLAEKYDSEKERQKALQMNNQELLTEAYGLEPDQGDEARVEDIRDRLEKLSDNYETHEWTRETEYGTIDYQIVRHESNQQNHIIGTKEDE